MLDLIYTNVKDPNYVITDPVVYKQSRMQNLFSLDEGSGRNRPTEIEVTVAVILKFRSVILKSVQFGHVHS